MDKLMVSNDELARLYHRVNPYGEERQTIKSEMIRRSTIHFDRSFRKRDILQDRMLLQYRYSKTSWQKWLKGYLKAKYNR